jgi:hypothetical protein
MDETNTFMPVMPAGYNNGMGDFGNGWWIILLFLFMGFGGNGFGFGGNGAANVGADVQRGFDQSAVMGGVSNIQNATTAGFGDLQTSLCGGFAGVTAAINNGFAQNEIADNARQMNNMQQMFTLQSQLSQCCCDNKTATLQTQTVVQNEGNLTRLAIQNQTQAILDRLCQNEIDTLKGTVVNLQNQLNMANLAASQTAQTQQIIAALTPTV